MREINTEELKKYENLEFTFQSYYKYTFYYEAITPEGNKLLASVGGCGSDIYELEVDTSPVALSYLDPDEVYFLDD